MKSLVRLLKHLKSYTPYVVLNVVFNGLNVIFSLVAISMLNPTFSLLFKERERIFDKPSFEFTVDSAVKYFKYQMSETIMVYGEVKALVFLCFFIVIIFFLKNLFRYLAQFFMAPIRSGIARDLRKGLFHKISTLPISYFTEARKGDVVTRMTSDVLEVEHSIISVLETLIKEPLTIVAFLYGMLYINAPLTLFVLIMLPLTALVIGRIARTLKRVSANVQTKFSAILSYIDETITGLRIVKAFNGEQYQINKFDKINDEHFELRNSQYRRMDLSSPLTEFLSICVLVLVVWYGGRLVLDSDPSIDANALKPQSFLTFLALFGMLIQPAKAFAKAFYMINKGLASTERIDSILDEDLKIYEKPDAIDLGPLNEGIEYKNVTFAYEDRKVLKTVNLSIKKGQTLALFGPSGAGKSTLADLLPRFYDPQEGSISIDGHDIKDVSLKSLRSKMGVVSQESILFNDTVINNIAYGMDNISEDDVIEAAKIANAHEFIMEMEKGYRTNIGDGGKKLSGGQRQRLSIARAILKNPEILILDEATSALDSESEKLVQDALFKLMENRTSIVIAHRLSTIQYADEIIVIQDGAITERGTHDGLMAKEGMYKKLVELQAF